LSYPVEAFSLDSLWQHGDITA